MINMHLGKYAVLAGPPGTGKTYVGLQITRAILHNVAATPAPNAIRVARQQGLRAAATNGTATAVDPAVGPVICVCYTNHALDQVHIHTQCSGLP